MLFHSAQFVAFFAVFFLLYHFVFRKSDQRLWLIALGSLFFYGTWSYKFIPFLLGTGFLDFFLANRIARESDARRKKGLLVLSVIANLSVLGYFKYTNFFLENVQELLELLGLQYTLPAFSIVTPLGISFYTFQSLSYTIDVYRGTFEPRRRIHEFIASLMFFPHLIAGPIVRSSYLLPQFEKLSTPDWAALKRGSLLFAAGLLKKTIADMVSGPVNDIFSSDKVHGLVGSWVGALGFNVQLYGDFAGYSDMAMGVAMVLGFTLPPNFDLPYLASSPLNYWNRWHISLSTWLRDYVFRPLGAANRRYPYLNLFITMVLAGLWHGPRWTYVVMGAYWGALLATTQWIKNHAPLSWEDAFSRKRGQVLLVILTFYLATLGNVIFRAGTVVSAFGVLRGMHGLTASPGAAHGAYLTLALIVVALVLCHALDYVVLRKRKIVDTDWVTWPFVAAALAFALAFAQPQSVFIYFEF